MFDFPGGLPLIFWDKAMTIPWLPSGARSTCRRRCYRSCAPHAPGSMEICLPKEEGLSLAFQILQYPLVMTNIGMENGHLFQMFPFKMMIFYSYVSLPEGKKNNQ